MTNAHVLDHCKTLRLNTKGGAMETLMTTPDDWIPHESYDVSVMPIELGQNFKWWSVGTDLLITPEIVEVYRIGYGDEAFLVGRLTTHDGHQKNTPAVRFGYISLMADPSEPIRSKGRDQEGFLVDCRSLSGFSGSPVFVMTTQVYRGDDADALVKYRQGQIRGTIESGMYEISGSGDISLANPNVKAISLDITNAGPWLLGIDFGHLPLWNAVYESDRETQTNYRVEANTGIACVIPAWRIMEALESDTLLKARKKADERLAKKIEAGSTTTTQGC